MLSESENPPVNEANYIRLVYIIFGFLWTMMIWYWSLLPGNDVFQRFLVIIPYILFIFGFSFAAQINDRVEGFMFRGNILTMGLILALPLLTWTVDKYTGDKQRFLQMAVVAVMLSMISLLDVWVSQDYLSIVKHVKSCLQTISIVLLLFVIYEFMLNNNTATNLEFIK